MAINGLPEDGQLRLAAVSLPPRRQIHAGYGSGGPVAWATTQPVPDAGRVWAALSRAHPRHRPDAVPALGPARRPRTPWDWDEFNDPEDISGLDGLDASAVLQRGWQRLLPWPTAQAPPSEAVWSITGYTQDTARERGDGK